MVLHERRGILNLRQLDGLFNRLFALIAKIKDPNTGLRGNIPVTDEFPIQRTSNVESGSVSHDAIMYPQKYMHMICMHKLDSKPKQIQQIVKIYGHNNRPISQISQCTSPMSHNAPFCNTNMHTCAHFCYKFLHYGIFA